MAFSASALSAPLNRKWSIGPYKIELQSCSAASGDTSGTVTAKNLSIIYLCIPLSAVQLSAAPTLSGTTATLAFNDPLATVAGYVLLIGA